MATKKDKGELVPAETTHSLPGETSADDSVLDQAVGELNRIYIAKGLEAARAMGEYVLDTFFAGDPANFRTRSNKHITFRRLAERDDLQPSYSHVFSSVAVVEQLRLLPEDIGTALSVSHHKALLPIKDESSKERLAKKAIEDGLSVEAFRLEIQRVLSKSKGKSKAGRPPLPTFVKGIKKIIKDIEFIESDDLGEETFSNYSAADAKKLLVDLEEQVKALDTYRQRVLSRIAELEK